MENLAGVYSITHTASGKLYIGSTKKFARRFKEHKRDLKSGRHQNKHMQNAWNKYGPSALVFKIEVITATKDMRFYEQLLMDNFLPEFNQSKSAYAGVPLGSKISQQHREKVGAASTRMWKEPAYRTRTAGAIKAAMTPEECLRKAERVKKLWASPTYRANAIAARVGKATNKGYKCTPEQTENRRKAARISNMKRGYGLGWKEEYLRRYPERGGDIDGK